MTLRIVVGYHFFKEGTNKLQDGFTSAGFLQSAKGPLAPYFHSMLDDHDGAKRLCVERVDEESPDYKIDTATTFSIWDDHVDRATSFYGFGSPDLVDKLDADIQALEGELNQLAADDPKVKELLGLIQEKEFEMESVESQPARANEIFESHKIVLDDWLRINRVEVLAHFGTEKRLDGFERDGENRDKVATYVDSLRDQVDTIRGDRYAKLSGWKTEIDEVWSSFENQINGLAVSDQLRGEPIPVHRPFQQEYSKLSVVDQVIPWFDTIVGTLLILGLFSRFASLAAAVFLLSVVLTQPPWIPGTSPTFYQCIELAACLVIFATAAGRMGGLDYFFSKRPTVPVQTEPVS
jgi:uncharacterized membrane protein YphA (DoxX/SURF4 family)